MDWRGVVFFRYRASRTVLRSSTALLWIALVVTAAVIALGSYLLWGLYVSAYASPRSEAPMPFSASAKPLRVGLARIPGGPGEWITFARVFARLQRDLGRPIIVRYMLPSEDQIYLIEHDQLDVVLMSTLAYLDVQDADRVTMIAAPVVENSPMDSAVAVVRTDSPARRIEDLRGKRYAASADLAGVSFMYWLLEKHGENPAGFFSESQADVQDVNLKKVQKGEADVTSVRRSALADWPKGMFRTIERSPDLGMPPIVARKSLDRATVDQVKATLVSAVSRGVVPADSVITGFRVPANDAYDFARVLDATDRAAEKLAFGSAHQ